MAPAEPRGRLEEERPPGRSIQQTAHDGATQIGEVLGGLNIGKVQGDLHLHHHHGTAPAPEIQLDLEAYRRHQLSQLAIWERQYTRLDVDPAVALTGQDLRPVPNFRLALTEAFAQQPRLIVLGEAGAGKTTSMLYLVASILPGGSLAGSLADFVPVYLELGRFRTEGPMSPLDSLLTLIAEALFRGKACPEPVALGGVCQLLKSHRFLLLLDGLNEVQAGLRAACLTAIDDLAKLYPEHRIVLSSRLHGFSPPQDWDIVLLRELEDAQIPGFVERHMHGEMSTPLLQSVLEAHNPLLRLPLFLSLVVRMSGSPLPDLQRRLRSRSGLIAQYVDFLLQRDLSTPAEVLSLDRLRDALARLAQAFQNAGQVLPLADARKVMGHPDEARQILDDLCGRGFLATDGQNLRFWHQTIQEYFYAGSVVRRWRGSKKEVGRMPWWLRRLASRPEEEEALTFMVAHLHDGEAEVALRYGLPVNPTLAISWADDLSLEGRAVPATECFPASVRRFALATIRYTRLSRDRASYIGYLLLLGFPLGLIAFFLLVSLASLLGLDKIDLVTESLFYCGMSLGYLPCLDALLLYPSMKKLESAFLAIPEIRAPSLRKGLGALAREISLSRMAGRDIRSLAQGISAMETVSSEGLIDLLRTNDSPLLIQQIGYLNTPLAVPVLKELSKINNFQSEAALEALATRANRLRSERPEIKSLLLAVWRNSATDCKIRRVARKLLLRAGEHPGGRSFLLRYFATRTLQGLIIGAGLVMIEVGLWLAAKAFFEVQDPVLFYLVFLLGLATLIWWDARRLGAREIFGCSGFEGSPPGMCFLLAFSSWGLLIPLYALNRQRIRRNAASVDWDALLQVLQAEGDHGTSRSIPRPPSPSFRR